ncbi:branched-chain amino acid ABC transporter permease [Ferrovibrio sp.]|jgi:branched-chain amino acid transport system permease protein|uniref:branched-chain amino acid ABC transporter permease n=1 Tax=Ferrovibrio sp. TaxID=1917215 RepID=UPI001B77BF9A|nr:branched-chain amino acid ABC transporter permease [Ferrovibrio sp.]MBP7065712.1 branched-chain amino acid ABC transporter permease [Ferrovibrio sp.]
MSEFLNYTINGALVGLLYALIAMGFIVIYRASKVFNFAQGELVVFGGFVVWWMITSLGLPYWLGIPLAFVAAAAFGYAIERIFFSRLVGESVFAMVMVTIGLLILLRGLILVLFGPQVRPFPIIFPLQPVIIGEILIPRSLFIGGIITVIVGFGLSWFFNRTRPGLRMTAVAEDHQVAVAMGISVKRSVAFAWILGSVLSTLGAIIYLSGKSLSFLASDIGLAALPVALLAGFESIAGVLLAGIIVGIIQGLVTAYIDPALGGSVGSVFPFIIMLVILFIRPTGMFGWKMVERV